MAINKEDPDYIYFINQIWKLNGTGSSPDDAFITYMNVMKNDRNPLTDKFFKKEELAKAHKKYVEQKKREESTWVPNKKAKLGVREYFLNQLHLQDFTAVKVSITERDNYLFGKDTI